MSSMCQVQCPLHSGRTKMKKILYFCGMHYRAAQANKCKNVIATSPEATSDCYGITCSDAQLCFCNPWTVAHQALLSMDFSKQEYWSGLPFLLQGIFLTQGSNPGLLHCRPVLYQLNHQGNHIRLGIKSKAQSFK